MTLLHVDPPQDYRFRSRKTIVSDSSWNCDSALPLMWKPLLILRVGGALAAELAADLVLYGDSLLLAGVKAQLQGCDGFTLRHVSPDCNAPGWQELLGAADGPYVLLFDAVVPLLRERPGLLLIGLDPSSDELLVMSGQRAAAASVRDLVSVISRGMGSMEQGFRPSRHQPRSTLDADQVLGGIPE